MVKKSKSILLAEFKKANKERRVKIANREGFHNSNIYLAFLQAKPSKTSKNKTNKVKVK